MKTLRFAPHLVEKILSGRKTSTWRLFDDKDLTKGDILSFVNSDTQEVFGIATINSVVVRTLGTFTDEDWEGHERYSSEEDMYATFRKHYGDNVDGNSEVKIIHFTFNPN